MPLLSLLLATLGQAPWKPYVLDGFVLSLPAKPERQKADGTLGHVWALLHNGRDGVSVAVTPMEPSQGETPDTILIGALDGTLEEGSTLSAQRDVVVDGWPGLEFRWKDASGLFGACEAVLAGKNLLIVSIAGLSATGIEAPFARFVASIKTPASGSQKTAGPIFKRYPLTGSLVSVEFPTAPKPFEVALPADWTKGSHLAVEADYGNRSYRALFTEVPEELRRTPPDAATLSKLLRTFNEHAAAVFRSPTATTAESLIDGKPGIRTSGADAKGTMAFRVESTYRGGRIVALLALVPTPLRNAPEVDRFFASVRLSATQPPSPASP